MGSSSYSLNPSFHFFCIFLVVSIPNFLPMRVAMYGGIGAHTHSCKHSTTTSILLIHSPLKHLTSPMSIPQHLHCPVPDSITPFTINTHQQPARFYGQGALLPRLPSGLRSHNYKFTLQPLIPCGFSTSSGLPLSCTLSLLFSHWHMHLDPGSLAHMQDTKSPPAVVNSK